MIVRIDKYTCENAGGILRYVFVPDIVGTYFNRSTSTAYCMTCATSGILHVDVLSVLPGTHYPTLNHLCVGVLGGCNQDKIHGIYISQSAVPIFFDILSSLSAACVRSGWFAICKVHTLSEQKHLCQAQVYEPCMLDKERRRKRQ
jgi:hypothetical protein